MLWPPEVWSSPGLRESPQAWRRCFREHQTFAVLLCRGRSAFAVSPGFIHITHLPASGISCPLSLVSSDHHVRLVSSKDGFVCSFSHGQHLAAVRGTRQSRGSAWVSGTCTAFLRFLLSPPSLPSGKRGSFSLCMSFYIFASAISQPRAPSLLHSRIQISSSRAHPISHPALRSLRAIYIDL